MGSCYAPGFYRLDFAIFSSYIELPCKTNSKIWNRTYFLQRTSNLEPDPGKIKDIDNIKPI